MSELTALLHRQSGVVSRAQLLDLSVEPTTVRRLLRRRDLVGVHPGVYVDHTGRLSWLQQSWAAVLLLEPAALCHQSAIRAVDGPGRRGEERVIHVAVDRTRSPHPPPGVRLHHLANLEQKVVWAASPPRVRVEHAILDVVAGCRDPVSAVAVLADAVQARTTTPERLLETLRSRARIAGRDLVEDLLQDLVAGTCSALEHGYLTLVERRHGLPTARRQVAASSRGPIFRDVEYRDELVLVELDGRLSHDDARSRDLDLERDLDAVIDLRVTARLGWGQVYGRPCATAAKVGRLLQRRGWQGAPVPCPECARESLRHVVIAG